MAGKTLQMDIMVKKSTLQELSFSCAQKPSARADARWWLGRQREVELFEQDFLNGFCMGVTE
jgi:hypothetical protein